MSAKPKVLIVDDEPEIGNLLALFLEDDFEVKTFTDPRVACEEITRTPYDLVISDIKMPFLSGLDVVKHVKAARPEVVVVLITAHAQTAADKDEAIGLGASEVLFKPFGDLTKIISILQKLVSRRSDTSAAPVKVAPAAPTIPKPRVLVMDDDNGIIEVLQILLVDDFEVVAFTNPMDAIASLATQKFDVVLTDLNMPELSGKEAIIKIRSLNASVPIMVMTGHGKEEPVAKEALQAGGNEILEKPFASVQVLVAQIGRLIK